jgi:hypothetical protein
MGVCDAPEREIGANPCKSGKLIGGLRLLLPEEHSYSLQVASSWAEPPYPTLGRVHLTGPTEVFVEEIKRPVLPSSLSSSTAMPQAIDVRDGAVRYFRWKAEIPIPSLFLNGATQRWPISEDDDH